MSQEPESPINQPSTSGLVMTGSQVTAGNQREVSRVDRIVSGRIRPWKPTTLDITQGIEYIGVPNIAVQRLYDEMADDNLEDDVFDAPLAEPVEVDSGSEEEDEPLSADELLEMFQEDADEIKGATDENRWEWRDDYETFTGKKEQFVQEVGPTVQGTNPSEIFYKLWDHNIINFIVEETNRYAWQTIARLTETETVISPGSRINDWVETTVPEFYCLIAVIILMGLCVRSRVDEYWNDGALGMPGFQRIMSRDRFLLLIKFLHFADNDCILERGDSRKIAKIEPLINYLNEKFVAVYKPRRELSVNESLPLWKRKLSWIQFIRFKVARLGVTSFHLCESVTGYVLKLLLSTRRGTPSPPIDGFSNRTAKIVIRLMQDFIGKGYTLFMDNYYNSVDLCRYLKRRATDVVGTLNRRRQNTPVDIKQLDENCMPRGAVLSRHSGDVSVTAWREFKLVTAISTYHKDDKPENSPLGEPLRKPKVVEEYNEYNCVDIMDQILSSYLLESNRGLKWYVKVFRRLLNVSLENSYIIYCTNMGQSRKLTLRQFRLVIAEDIIAQFGENNTPAARSHRHNACVRLDKSSEHFPDTSPAVSGRTAKHNKFKRSRCVRCRAARKRTDSDIFCGQCKVYLCPGQCWKEYHSLEIL